MNKVMWLSDSVITPTGFANQTREITKRLCRLPDFDVYHVAWNRQGQATQTQTLIGGEKLNMTILSGGRQNYAADVLPEYFLKYRPNIFGVLLDTFMLYPWILNYNFAPAKTFFYFPSDGGYFPKNCEQVLLKFNNPVAMSKYAQKQVKDLYNIDAHYIPHATDPTMFYPITEEQKIQARAKYKIPIDGFVFGDVARNQGRKMLGLTIMAFSEFMKRNPDANAYLFLHTDFEDAAAHSDLRFLAQRYNVAHRVIGTGLKFFHGVPVSFLNEIYNCMDVRVSTTTGEGFGICTIESMACEIPNVITDYTTTKELLVDHNAGIPAKVAAEIPGTWDVMRGFVDIHDFAAQMEVLYNSENKRKEMGRNGRQAVQKYYSWDSGEQGGVFNQWVQFLREMRGNE